MLNIDDIKRRLFYEPEPVEIKDIRENISSSFSNLEFIEDGHKYYLHNADGTISEMESVTNVCQRYEPYADWDMIAERKARRDKINVNTLKRSWKEKNILSTSNGTMTHLFAEAYMRFFMGDIDNMPESIRKYQYKDGFLIPYGKKQEAIVKFYEDLYKVCGFYPVMPETKIYINKDNNIFNIKYNIAGTFDALFAFKKSNDDYALSIFDWKTNASLENAYNIKRHNMLLPPFDKEFIEEPKSLYTLQLSLYSIGLMQLGYNVMGRKLVHLKGDGEYDKISVPDVTECLINDLSK